MRIIVLLLLLSLPLAYAFDTSDLNTGELVSDSSYNADVCNNLNNIPSFCKINLEGKTTGSVSIDDIDSLLNMPNANKELSEAEIIQLRSDNSADRLIALYDLFGAFWRLLFELVTSLFIFLEVYLVLWVLFVGIPKVLNYFISIILRSGKL